MSHVTLEGGRRVVECDDVVPDADAPRGFSRCARRSRTFVAEPSIFDLARGWSVAPYPDDFAHGRAFLPNPNPQLLMGTLGEVDPTHPLAGITGDLHTCSSCRHQPARRGAVDHDAGRLAER